MRTKAHPDQLSSASPGNPAWDFDWEAENLINNPNAEDTGIGKVRDKHQDISAYPMGSKARGPTHSPPIMSVV